MLHACTNCHRLSTSPLLSMTILTSLIPSSVITTVITKTIQQSLRLTGYALISSTDTITMAAETQHTEPHSAVEHEPLTGLNLTLDNPSNDNTSKQSSATAEVDPEAVSKANSNPSATINSKPTAEHKKVSIAETGEEVSGVDKSFEIASLGDEDNEDGLDKDIGGFNTPTGVGEKKKKKRKKKPKSQRGLVSS